MPALDASVEVSSELDGTSPNILVNERSAHTRAYLCNSGASLTTSSMSARGRHPADVIHVCRCFGAAIMAGINTPPRTVVCHAAVHADMGTNNPSEEQLDLVTDRECPP